MRAGACAPPYALSAEAAAALKHSLILSRRRGHAQVTPLHVAATLLTPRTSLLHRACLNSAAAPQHHPLQCRALELCFNVALNRLPASPAAAVHHHQPSLSNALIAALKRAQAHQRRGCSDQQQQHQQPPLIAVKVELEQLILSILDDPSVSRVMREAGFSSAAVKNNLEDYSNSASTVFQYYNTAASSPPPESHRPIANPTSLFQPHLFSLSSSPPTPFLSPQKKPHFLCMMNDVKCQMKQPPLDVHEWDLQSASGLRLSLSTRGRDSTNVFSENSSPVSDKKLLSLKEETHVLTCCQECRYKYEKEAALKSFSDKETASTQLPSWLKPHANQTLEKDDLNQLRKKYNKLCQNLHQGNQNPCTNQEGYLGRNCYSASYNPSSFAFPSSKVNRSASTLPRFRRQQPCHVEFICSHGSSKNISNEPNLDSLKMMEDKEVKITLALGNWTCTDEMKHEKFVMWDLLKENVPWQTEAIPSIIEALMDSEATGHDQFLLMQGNDNIAKRRLSLAIAGSMSGSLIHMNMRSNERTSKEHRERIEIALRSHEKVVVLIEDVEFADHELVKFLARVLEAGRRDTGRVIFVLTTDGDEICNLDSVVHMKLIVYNTGLQMPTHLDHKRGADWDPPADRRKVRRSNEMEEVSSGMRRHVSPNGLDLNIMADEEEEKLEDSSPVSSDLTTMEPPHNSLTFLNKIKSRFVLNKDSDQDRQAKEMFMSKFKRAFREAGGWTSLSVEEKLLENVLGGSGLYLNGSFEKWLQDIFRTSLAGVSGEVSVRVCLGGEGGSCVKDGFMGTSLPKRIPVSYIG